MNLLGNSAFAPVRAELCRLMVEAVPRAQRTLVVELLAEGFIDAFFDRRNADAQPLPMLNWVEQMCLTHGATAPGVSALFGGACASLERYSGTHGAVAVSLSSLGSLDRSIAAIVAKCDRETIGSTDRLDETDARINTLILRLDRTDPLSAEHSRAVGAWCMRLARRLSLSDGETTFSSRGGLIHDVGKITTPFEILHAPRRLDDEEFAVMRAHTTAGECIIADQPDLHIFGPVARSHHERLDGTGYPDGLRGDDLSLTIRIVSVADCFNAMIGRRPYRPPMAPAAALEELDRGCGTQFDPAVVAAMHDVVLPLRTRSRRSH